jgi:hypothetical protein
MSRSFSVGTPPSPPAPGGRLYLPPHLEEDSISPRTWRNAAVLLTTAMGDAGGLAPSPLADLWRGEVMGEEIRDVLLALTLLP